MYTIFEVEKEKAAKIADVLSDDLISRQTTVIRDGESLGLKDGITYVMIEGSEEALDKSKELFSKEGIEEAEELEKAYKAIKEDEEKAASGMGTIFG